MSGATSVGRWAPGMSTHFLVVSSDIETKRGTIPALRRSRARPALFVTWPGATLIRTISRLSTSVLPPASRMSPRGAGRSDDAKCCLMPIAFQYSYWNSCSYPDFTIRATANNMSEPETIARRLGAFSAILTGQVAHVRVVWHAHAEPLHYWSELRET